jgi:hypothetical protein
MKRIKEMLIFIFGKQRKVRYIRMVVVLILIIFGAILIQNVACGFKNGSFYFEWTPAADIKIDK